MLLCGAAGDEAAPEEGKGLAIAAVATAAGAGLTVAAAEAATELAAALVAADLVGVCRLAEEVEAALALLLSAYLGTGGGGSALSSSSALGALAG